MKVTVKIRSDISIFRTEDCFEEVRNIRGGAVATLIPVQGERRLPLTVSSLMPGKAILLLEAEEKGGKHPDGTVDAMVVCGVSGKQLRPYMTENGPLRPPNGIHARFAVPCNVVTIHAHEDGRVTVVKHSLSLGDGDVVGLSEEHIFHGFPRNLSGWKAKYKAAAKAAADKGNTMNCRTPKFVAERRQA
jgi:hypothetical protein